MAEIIIGRGYILQDELGSGGMGTVYLGADTATDQIVAIKALKSELAQPEMIERFRREGEALRDLNHPNIVKMLDMFEYNEQHYLVMEYVAGNDLAKRLAQETLELELILKLSIDLADALTRAHKLGIVHRDLKPANVLIGEDDVLRLTDFGVAHVGSKERVTDTDAIIGTIDYLPPEAFDGGAFDVRGDIWAFGVILFECLTGERPFKGNTLIEIIQAITTQPIPDLEALRPDLSPQLVKLIYGMLKRDQQERIPSVRIVGTHLEAILEGRDISSPTARFADDDLARLSQSKHNLPVQSTPFIGRLHDLSELEKLLNVPAIRLITILAHGGMGKTRLALATAETQIGSYTEGVYFVSLAPLSSPNDIVTTIAENIGFVFHGENPPTQQLVNFLKDRTMLLVLDNFEHLLEGAGLVNDIIQSTSSIKIIVTSRERMNLRGETLYSLHGMDFPTWEAPDDALEYDAVKLFMQSAKQIQPDFELLAGDLDYMARICRLTVGMPLGIELAAGWVDMLSLEKIADEIQSGIDILETDMRDVPERQRSVRAIFEQTWDRLNKTEQSVFMILSVFRGGFTLESAEAVAGANLRHLRKLGQKSFIQTENNERYGIHELLRQFGTDKLAETGESCTIQAKHATYFADFMAERKQDIKTNRQLEALELIDLDYDNVRVAWQYTVNQKDWKQLPAFLQSLGFYCNVRAKGQECIDLLEPAITSLQTTSPTDMKELAMARIWSQLSWAYGDIGFLEKSANISNEAIRIMRQHDNLEDLIMALEWRAMPALYLNQPDIHSKISEEGLKIARILGDLYWECKFLYWSAWSSYLHNDFGQALRFSKQSLVLGETVVGVFDILFNYTLPGYVYEKQKQFAQAQYWMEQALVIAETFNQLSMIGQVNAQLGKVAIVQHDYATARTRLRQALSVQWNTGYRYLMSYTLLYLAQMFAYQNDEERAVKILATIHQHLIYYEDADLIARELHEELETKLGSQRFAVAWERGKNRDLNDLVKELLAELEDKS
jgi:predicted ATPase